ncbi:KdsC family phosphatase [Chlorobium phaeovibrioides]|uniref:KdsC family phosphatase n=1 Tax=Chlorobium phaeovibrioides TaxID=1094 RepID=UPI001C8C4F12|nr:HAD family hydrolase [Chlorobium phaeovibrioides]
MATLSLIVLDVDGVLTDGGLWYDQNGEFAKRFDVRDGLGIRLLQQAGIEIAFLSGGVGGAIQARADHLGVKHCFVGVKNKADVLLDLLNKLGIAGAQTGFVGDDLNDLTVRPNVGLLVAPSDAVKPFKRQADLVLCSSGGSGAVRELADLILMHRDNWKELSNSGWKDRNN